VVRRVEPWLVGTALILMAIALLLAQQFFFGYENREIAEKLIIALLNYGLTLIALQYGIV